MSGLNINSPCSFVSYENSIPARNNKLNFHKTNLAHQPEQDTVFFSGKSSKSGQASGTFADKKFTVECSEGLTNRSLKGYVGGVDFNIRHNGKVLKSDTLTGDINNKALNLKVKEGLFSKSITGEIGQSPVDLKVTDTWGGYKIKGLFKNKKIDVNLDSKFSGYALKSDKMDLRIKNKTLFGTDINVSGSYKEDPDLIPVLLDMVYCLNDEELMAVMCCM